ncbi:MAG: hypothetical protein WHT08_16740 [Bryobacteraceae bacterium]
MTFLALPLSLFLFQFSAPQGPEGIVYNKDWPTLRLPTLRKGKWDAWRLQSNPGNGGQRVTLSANERAQVEGHLKAVAEAVESTPYAQAQTGWFAERSIAWVNTRFPNERFSISKLPVMSFYSLYPFWLMDKKIVKNGVEQWVPDWSHETVSITFWINPEHWGPPGGLILQESADDGSRLSWYADPQPEGEFGGYPVYGGYAVIARKGRPLFRDVTVARALAKFLPLYREDWNAAQQRFQGLQRKLAETESEDYARREWADFEREYGAWKATRPRDYEFRRKVRADAIERARQEAREAAAPPAGSPQGAWYWEPKLALEAMERLASENAGARPACFEAAGSGTALYKSGGYIRVAGSAPNCKPIREPNPDYYDATLPRTAPQMIALGDLTRCIDLKTKQPKDQSIPAHVPHGCNVHLAIWAQMDWTKLAAVLAP